MLGKGDFLAEQVCVSFIASFSYSLGILGIE